jgi:hypothetical protein
MTIDDVQFGLGLSRQANWNQTESDSLRFLKMQPDGCFLAELDAGPVEYAAAGIL